MNKKIKYLLALAVATAPLIYVLWHDHGQGLSFLEHGQKPSNTQHCFYCRHTGKVLFGSLALTIGCAVYIYKDWSSEKA